MQLKNVKTLVGVIGVLTALMLQLGCSLRKRSLRLYNEALQQGQQFDAIIVPGVPFVNGRWDSVMRSRVLWSYLLYERGLTRNIIYSGGAVYSPYYEAKIMGLYAIQLGIPAQNIFYDTLAEHSTENVYYAYELARSLGFKSIALATNPGQSKLLHAFTRKHFITPVVHLPSIDDSLKRYEHLDPVIDPASALAPGFVSLIERQSWRQRWRGTLGKNIPWKDKDQKKASGL